MFLKDDKSRDDGESLLVSEDQLYIFHNMLCGTDLKLKQSDFL